MTEVKEKDVQQIVWYLTKTFNQVTKTLPKANRTKQGEANVTYKLQTEFAYLLNEVVQGPECMQQSYISECNEFINYVVANKAALASEN